MIEKGKLDLKYFIEDLEDEKEEEEEEECYWEDEEDEEEEVSVFLADIRDIKEDSESQKEVNKIIQNDVIKKRFKKIRDIDFQNRCKREIEDLHNKKIANFLKEEVKQTEEDIKENEELKEIEEKIIRNEKEIKEDEDILQKAFEKYIKK